MYRKFKLSEKVYQNLTKEERKLMELLSLVVEDIARVYKRQINDGFYPKGVTKQELENTGKKNPSVLSPFTFVERKAGKLKATPYHFKYASDLKPIAEKIEKAANLSSNKTFKLYLQARARSLLDGSYKQADIAWLNVKNSKIDFSLGLFERYQDKILFLKRAYQGHVGVVDKENTKLAEEIKEVLYATAKLSFDKSHSTDIPKKGVQILVEDTPATAGYMADVVFSGEHFPSDLEVMKQYGSKIIIYASQLKLKFEKLHYPTFKALFEKRFAAKYSKELLLKATVWNILLYELGRQLHKFFGARERLQELYGPIDEINGAVSGVQHGKYLVIKGLISQDELEAIMIMHIVWMFTDWLVYQENKGIESYMKGDAVALNLYINSRALSEKNGIYWPNFSKMFFGIEELADTLVRLLQVGSYNEAHKFIEENMNLNNFERLSKNLKNIKSSV